MPDPLTTEQPEKLNLARIEALAEKASPGPYSVVREDQDSGDIWFDVWSPVGSVAHCGEDANSNASNNAKFFASARQSVPALAAKLREARLLLSFLLGLSESQRNQYAIIKIHVFLNSISWEDEGDAGEEAK